MLVVAVFSVDAFLFFHVLRPDLSPYGCRNKCLSGCIVPRPTLEVATKRLLHLQVKIPG